MTKLTAVSIVGEFVAESSIRRSKRSCYHPRPPGHARLSSAPCSAAFKTELGALAADYAAQIQPGNDAAL